MSPLLRRAVLISLSLPFTTPIPAAPGQGLPGSITGHVTDGGAKGVAGASVQLIGTPYWARTRDDGSFRLDNVAPGSHLLRARLLGYASDSARVTVTSGAAAEATLALHPAAVSLDNVLVVAHRMGWDST
ncbi:MAG TPA: carboxypeptidase-like regulatory domain-containing protein [Gemmatimonadales bacterium]|nr:carboxypeptidase-like regulatory domain-containing protein [Gemmatimonadales bacterium]